VRQDELSRIWVGALNLSLIRFVPDDRYALVPADDQEVAVLSHQVPGEAVVHGASVHLAAERRNGRLAVVATSQSQELGWIQLSWMPGRHQIRIGDSEFRVARRWFRGGWSLCSRGAHLATVELNGWFSPKLGITGPSQIEAGRVIVGEHAAHGADIALALVLLLAALAVDLPVGG
jgi:hypothetical protein